MIPDKDKEIAFLKETLSEKEKEIAHLKDKLCHVQQHGQTKEFDFVKQMATIDEELRKAKKNIDEATETLVKNKSAEVEELHSERQTFNGKCVEWVAPTPPKYRLAITTSVLFSEQLERPDISLLADQFVVMIAFISEGRSIILWRSGGLSHF